MSGWEDSYRPSAGAQPSSGRSDSGGTRFSSGASLCALRDPTLTLQCASRCRPRGAPVGPLWSRCDAAVLGAERAGCSTRAGMIYCWPPPRWRRRPHHATHAPSARSLARPQPCWPSATLDSSYSTISILRNRDLEAPALISKIEGEIRPSPAPILVR